MRTKPFVVVTASAAALSLLSSCTCNACPTDTTAPSTFEDTGETGDTADSDPPPPPPSASP